MLKRVADINVVFDLNIRLLGTLFAHRIIQLVSTDQVLMQSVYIHIRITKNQDQVKVLNLRKFNHILKELYALYIGLLKK